MPEYFYTAKSFKGEVQTGVLAAQNQSELAKLLHQDGYFLISATLEEKNAKKSRIAFSIPFLNRVSLADKLFFTRNLEVMVGAGISLPRAIGVLAGQARSKKFKAALLDIADKIIKGENFSSSLKKYSNIFPELFQNMIEVGEETGTLEEVLKTLTQQMEKEYELRSKVVAAMIYPAIVITAMVGIGILMLVAVVPKLAETFDELGVELPLTTRLVISSGVFMADQWFLMITAFVVIVLFFRYLLKTKAGKRGFDKVMLKMPIISSIVRKTNSAYTVRGLSSLFSAGVPIIRALEIVSRALGNIYFREAMIDVAEQVRKGSKLSEAMSRHSDVYSSIVTQMIEVGEETGETSDILKKLADFFEEEATNAAKNLSAVIEPALMLLVGAMVGFFAVSMIQPMYSMLGAIQ